MSPESTDVPPDRILRVVVHKVQAHNGRRIQRPAIAIDHAAQTAAQWTLTDRQHISEMFNERFQNNQELPRVFRAVKAHGYAKIVRHCFRKAIVAASHGQPPFLLRVIVRHLRRRVV
jgi:hypothetical protein